MRVLTFATLMQNLPVLTYLIESGVDIPLCTTGVMSISTTHITALVGNMEMIL
jgi:hypothetical protein